MSGTVTSLTTASFDETVQSAESPVVVDFWAEWCGPCKKIAPILDEIAAEYPDSLQIAKLNIDDNPDIAVRFHVRSIPTLLIFQNGEMVKSIPGAKSKSALLEEFDEFLSSP